MSLLTVSNLIAWSAQSGLLIVVALLTLRVLRLDAPAVRYRLLRLVLAACLVLPFLQPHRAAPVAEGKARTAMTVTAVNVAPTQGRDGHSFRRLAPHGRWPWRCSWPAGSGHA